MLQINTYSGKICLDNVFCILKNNNKKKKYRKEVGNPQYCLPVE